ncbi:MAG: hypothetical protein F9K43_01145 [Bauldia sp.]|nr:MAG: hypothetical protein F9K43_01145 [Bauldia sp.]
MATPTEELLAACIDAARTGADFPTVWHSILRRHPIVVGSPVQRMDGTTAILEVPLLFGQRLVVGPGSTDYAIVFG